jgi:hypothetical protein
MHSDNSIGDQLKNIFCLGCECYEDIDHNKNGKSVLPPLTSLFQNNEIANEIVPPSPWNFGNDDINSPMAPAEGTFNKAKSTFVSEGAPE